MALSLFASTTKDSQTSSSSITCPANVAEGDLIVIFDCVGNSSGTPTEIVDGDFTKIVGTYITSTRNVRTVASYKIAVGTEGGTEIDRMASNAGNGGTALAVFRDSGGPIVGVTVSTPTSEATNNDPADQSVLAGAGTPPLIVFAGYVSSGTVSPQTFSTTATGTVQASGNGHPTSLAYKLYDSSPANTTIGMDDEGYGNTLVGFFIELEVEGATAYTDELGPASGDFTLQDVNQAFTVEVSPASGNFAATTSSFGYFIWDVLAPARGEFLSRRSIISNDSVANRFAYRGPLRDKWWARLLRGGR